MSKVNYVSDSNAVITTQGLRMVTKSDSFRYVGQTDEARFYLELEYKGLSKKVCYANVQERDAMYSNLALLLTKRVPDAGDSAE